jgi:hypothetical protein
MGTVGKRDAWIIKGVKGSVVKYYHKSGCDCWSQKLSKARLFDKEPKEKFLDALTEAWKFDDVSAVLVSVAIRFSESGEDAV